MKSVRARLADLIRSAASLGMLAMIGLAEVAGRRWEV
jgi:hypothetical protein